ncbi:hypothetical protein C8F04DRAFT_708345 [Mycena alexandri]|uniref:RING-type domain-containing protein n=1 Tax=Mycena alexandri TaxID=1745969 RepID=A0AAD6SPQ9_9AGAR|nr:hypothetical protein C8F04DRAFT_708345 [Mycena alexandri]
MDVDEHRANDSDDSMPDLQSVSNSSDSDDGDEGTSAQQRLEEDDGDSEWSDVDDDDEPMPPLEPTVPSSGLRRRHEDTDQDRERDRRHPSQRVPPQINVNPPPPTANNNNNNNGNAAHGPPHNLAQLFSLLTRGLATATAGANIQFGVGMPPDIVFGAPPPQPKDSPANAARIVGGLERVPEGLVRRLERVCGAKANVGGDELGAVGGDSGCAICWDRLLDGEGAEFATATPANADPPTANDIIALPCAHTFHAACLLPWFARPGQTTCPTCRFDVDPEGVIWFGGRKGRRRGFGFPGFGFFAGPGGAGGPPFGAPFAPQAGVDVDAGPGPWGDDGDPEVEAEFFDDGGEGDFAGAEMAFDLVMGPGGGIGIAPVGAGGMPPFPFHPMGMPMPMPMPMPQQDEDEDEDVMPPLEPIPARATTTTTPAPAPTSTNTTNTTNTNTAAAGTFDDMPPLEPIPSPSGAGQAPPATRTQNAPAPAPAPAAAAAQPPTANVGAAQRPAAGNANAPPPTANANANANAPPPTANANANAPPPNANANANRTTNPGTFTFGLDIVFSTLGPIPPPANLAAAAAAPLGQGQGQGQGQGPILAQWQQQQQPRGGVPAQAQEEGRERRALRSCSAGLLRGRRRGRRRVERRRPLGMRTRRQLPLPRRKQDQGIRDSREEARARKCQCQCQCPGSPLALACSLYSARRGASLGRCRTPPARTGWGASRRRRCSRCSSCWRGSGGFRRG